MNTLTIQTAKDERLGVTTATVEGFIGTHRVESMAGSKCSAPDKFDEKLGEVLASARALREAADKLEKGARREIKRRDLRRARQEEIDEQRRIQRQANTAAIRAQLAQQGILKQFTDIGADKLASV